MLICLISYLPIEICRKDGSGKGVGGKVVFNAEPASFLADLQSLISLEHLSPPQKKKPAYTDEGLTGAQKSTEKSS